MAIRFERVFGYAELSAQARTMRCIFACWAISMSDNGMCGFLRWVGLSSANRLYSVRGQRGAATI